MKNWIFSERLFIYNIFHWFFYFDEKLIFLKDYFCYSIEINFFYNENESYYFLFKNIVIVYFCYLSVEFFFTGIFSSLFFYALLYYSIIFYFNLYTSNFFYILLYYSTRFLFFQNRLFYFWISRKLDSFFLFFYTNAFPQFSRNITEILPIIFGVQSALFFHFFTFIEKHFFTTPIWITHFPFDEFITIFPQIYYKND